MTMRAKTKSKTFFCQIKRLFRHKYKKSLLFCKGKLVYALDTTMHAGKQQNMHNIKEEQCLELEGYANPTVGLTHGK